MICFFSLHLTGEDDLPLSLLFYPLSGENAVMPKERDGERQQHMSTAMDAALTGLAYRLCSSSLQA